MGGKHLDALVGQSQRRFDEPRPGSRPCACHSASRPGRTAGTAHDPDPNGVVDAAPAKRNFEPDKLDLAALGAQARHRAEEVEGPNLAVQ